MMENISMPVSARPPLLACTLPQAFALTTYERAMLVAVGALLSDAQAITVSARRIALIVDADLFDAFNEAVDAALDPDTELDGACEREIENEHGSLDSDQCTDSYQRAFLEWGF